MEEAKTDVDEIQGIPKYGKAQVRQFTSHGINMFFFFKAHLNIKTNLLKELKDKPNYNKMLKVVARY